MIAHPCLHRRVTRRQRSVGRPPILPHLAAAAALMVSSAAPASGQAAPDAAPPAAGTPFEAPGIVDAASLLPVELIAGPYHRVRPGARVDGYMAYFTIDSDFGTYVCGGRWKVAQRVQEIAALAKLAETSKGEVFADALKQSMTKPVDAVKNIASDPVGSVKRLPGTIGHFFKRTGTAIAEGAQSIAQSANQQDGAAAGAQLEGAAKGAIGFNKALLKCAQQLNVDPYTDNAVLRDRMEEVAWVFYAGGLPISVGVAVASGGASIAMKTTVAAGLPEEVYALTPSELLVRSRESLQALGVAEPAIDGFTKNPALSPSVRWSIIASLQRLGPLPGRPEVIGVAASLDEAPKAEFLDQSLRLLAEVPSSVQGVRFTEIVLYGRLPAGRDEAGNLWIPAAVDHVLWTPQVAEFAQRPDAGDAIRILCLPRDASLSEAAANGLTTAGWRASRL